jgi:hypothetical protein
MDGWLRGLTKIPKICYRTTRLLLLSVFVTFWDDFSRILIPIRLWRAQASIHDQCKTMPDCIADGSHQDVKVILYESIDFSLEKLIDTLFFD